MGVPGLHGRRLHGRTDDADTTDSSFAGRNSARASVFFAIIYGIILLLGALTGGSNPLQPLASVNLGGGPTAEAEHELPFQRIKSVADLDREMILPPLPAASSPYFSTFYADWCVSCMEMEAYTFTDADVQAALFKHGLAAG